ncbi:MAG: NADPH-dependent oxidoreductase, partial [Betaproteobacteria bacterium]
MTSPSILLMAGSARRESLARRLALACVSPLQHAGAEVNLVELADYPAPLYHGDLEAES